MSKVRTIPVARCNADLDGRISEMLCPAEPASSRRGFLCGLVGLSHIGGGLTEAGTHPDAAHLALRSDLLVAHAEHAGARPVENAARINTPEYEATSVIARRLWGVVEDILRLPPPRTVEGLAVVGLALALDIEGRLYGADEGQDESKIASAARAILAVTRTDLPPGFIGYGDEPDFRGREHAALHGQPGHIPAWALVGARWQEGAPCA